MDLPPLPDRLRDLAPSTAAPPRLPAALDRASEAWWSRPPLVRWVVVATLVVTGLALVGRGAARSPWGPPTPVLVTASDLPSGSLLGNATVVSTTWPATLVPADALTVPEGRLRTDVPAGQVLTDRHVAPDLASLVPAGRVAVPVSVDGLPDVAAGQVVDVVASGMDGLGHVLARRADVLAVEAGWAWLAVPEEASGEVTAAATSGRLGLALRRPGPAPSP